jgi:branched-subunit amino acid transport protein
MEILTTVISSLVVTTAVTIGFRAIELVFQDDKKLSQDLDRMISVITFGDVRPRLFYPTKNSLPQAFPSFYLYVRV